MRVTAELRPTVSGLVQECVVKQGACGLVWGPDRAAVSTSLAHPGDYSESAGRDFYKETLLLIFSAVLFCHSELHQ